MATLGVENKDFIKNIYEYSPAVNNLYKVEIFPYSSEDITDLSNHLKFHSTNVDFNGESLSLKRNDITKRFQLESTLPYKRTDNLSITIRESDKWMIKKYHEKWLSCFYDRDNDCFISADGINHKLEFLYRKIRVTLPSSSSVTNDKNVITFIVLPSNSGDLKLGWGSSSKIVSHSIIYYVEDWHWEE